MSVESQHLAIFQQQRAMFLDEYFRRNGNITGTLPTLDVKLTASGLDMYFQLDVPASFDPPNSDPDGSETPPGE